MNDPGMRVRFRELPAPDSAPRPAVFLDRDGVVVQEVGYLRQTSDIKPVPGAIEAIATLNRSHWPVVLVTNQSGIARGYFSWEQFDAVQAAIEQTLAQAGAWFDAVLACGYHPDGEGPLASDHPCRKPQPGLLLCAADALRLDLAQSWMVGDKLSDLQAGANAGMQHLVLVGTGYGVKTQPEAMAWAERERRLLTQIPSLGELPSLLGPPALFEQGVPDRIDRL